MASERINLAWGEDTVGRSTVYRWFKKSDESEESLEDQPRSGRPKEVDRQAVLEKIEEKLLFDNLVIHFFNSEKLEFYAHGIDLLQEKWQEVLEVEGEYSDCRDFIALEKSTSRIVHMINEEDFDQPVNADAWLNKFPNVTLTAKYVDCHVYFMRHSCLATIIKERNFASLKADVIPYMLSKQCSLPCGDDKVPKCMAYLLQHGNAIVAAHVNNLGAYLEINKSVLKCLPRISSLIFTGRVFDGRLNGIHTNESLVAEDVKVGERALIKKSVIAPRCTVGEKSNIQGSVVMEGSTIGRDVKITQSIICCGAVIGDNSELVNVIVTKDQKVGANAKIHNEVVDCDDEDNAWENGL